MKSAESTLLAELESHGFEIDGLRDRGKRSITNYAREVYMETSPERRPGGTYHKISFEKNVIEAKDGNGCRVGLVPWYALAASVLSLVIVPFDAWLGAAFVALLGIATIIFSLTIGPQTYQDVWIRGLWRYLTNFGEPEPISDEEVVEHLSRKLREEKEKALGVTIADEKKKLEKAKENLTEYRQTLKAQRKGNEDHGMENEIDGFIAAIDGRIADIDNVLSRIDAFLTEVRQLAQDIASEILPTYERRQKILEIFKQVPVELKEASEHLQSAEAKLEELRLNLDHKLEALQSAITQANQISAELGKLTAEDALREGGVDGVIGSVEQLTEGDAEDASAEVAQRVRA